MHKYFIKTPWLVRKLFPSYVWSLPADEKVVYLSFDDGPHPTITPWVLDLLNQYHAQASFFCIGNNVERFPDVYQRILSEGHAVGNHTYHHLNGWKSPDEKYVADIAKAAALIKTGLFRPPYGRIKTKQAKLVGNALGDPEAKIIMWDVLSGDFDQEFSIPDCFNNVADNVTSGSIVVFHDSEKAFRNLKGVLQEVLEHLSGEGYILKKLPG